MVVRCADVSSGVVTEVPVAAGAGVGGRAVKYRQQQGISGSGSGCDSGSDSGIHDIRCGSGAVYSDTGRRIGGNSSSKGGYSG